MAPALRDADVAVINLETAVGSLGEPEPKQYVFQASPDLLRAAQSAGVDVVNLANNHSLDYGRDALAETIANARAAGLAVVGAGRDAAEAYAPAVLGPPGRRVAVVGLTRVHGGGWAAGPDRAGVASAYDVSASVGAVRAAAAAADHVVVMIHWGIENTRCPDGDVQALADRLVAAGADVVAGHHPHVLQGVHQRGRALVAFSLGNFVWYHHRSPTDVTGVLTARIDGGGVRSHRFEPARIDDTGTPQPMAAAEADRVRREVAAGYC
jgi:poly-gamma-glutamate synthesis protein (capsule biosynthesis protein)